MTALDHDTTKGRPVLTSYMSGPQRTEPSSLDGRSVLCGLIGRGIGSSLSPALHEREGHRHGLRLTYHIVDLDALALDAADLPRLVKSAADLGFRGLNITHPFKRTVIDELDELSLDAERLGAVNTVLFDGGRAIGHNTDWSGFGRSFDDGLAGARVDHVVQLGAGGAGSAVAYAVASRGPSRFTLSDRDVAAASALAGTLSTQFPLTTFDVAVTTDDVERAMAVADGLVHATPVGMSAHPGIALPATLLRPEMWVADIVYRPVDTELLTAASAAGCRTLPGTGMVVHQAADAFEIFTGRKPDTDRMIAHMTALIADE